MSNVAYHILLVVLAFNVHGAVVLDRVAVVVGKHAIKSSDIERDLRLTEFLNREKLDLGADAKHTAAERLIDQTILRDEIANGGYSRPTDADVAALLNQLRKDRFGGSDTRLREGLSSYALSENQLRAQLLWQLTVLKFIDQRFRAGVLVNDDEVREYYDRHLAELKREYPKDNNFEALAPRVRASLEGEHVNKNFTDWIEQARKRNRIEYMQGAFA
ncbi:MAG: hypothetical protein M3Z23_17985 [Acidobacteriota bacterium]|nr:hypothetical protein [Acidobacteriota bacterium]